VPLGHLPFLDPESVANVQAIGSLPSVRFEKRLGAVPKADLKKSKPRCSKPAPCERNRSSERESAQESGGGEV
jgi:hypothetical protein